MQIVNDRAALRLATVTYAFVIIDGVFNDRRNATGVKGNRIARSGSCHGELELLIL